MIYVFKTSVKTKKQVKQLRPHINRILPNQQWNFDLHDCDKILRIDSDKQVVTAITSVLHAHQFHCEELQ